MSSEAVNQVSTGSHRRGGTELVRALSGALLLVDFVTVLLIVLGAPV